MILLLSCINAVTYRLGGASYEDFAFLPKWLVKGYIRIVGAVVTYVVIMLNIWHWTVIPSAIILGVMVNSYHKWLNPLFGKSTRDCYWFNYLAHAIGISLSALPYVWQFGLWQCFIYRTIVLSVLIVGWSLFWKNVNIEESGRGFFITATLKFFV
jgi:hypothetical protein